MMNLINCLSGSTFYFILVRLKRPQIIQSYFKSKMADYFTTKANLKKIHSRDHTGVIKNFFNLPTRESNPVDSAAEDGCCNSETSIYSDTKLMLKELTTYYCVEGTLSFDIPSLAVDIHELKELWSP